MSFAKTAAMEAEKSAYCGSDSKNEWLEQFEGTPLLPQALSLAEEELQTELEGIEKRIARRQEMEDCSWEERDRLGVQKKLLELQLIAQRNGMETSGAGGEGEVPQEEPAEQPGQPAEGPAEAAVNSQPGQEAVQAIKEAAARMAQQSLVGALRRGRKTLSTPRNVAKKFPSGRPPGVPHTKVSCLP